MEQTLYEELGHDRLRVRFSKYTRKAFQMLPKLEEPDILDVGCGSGVPTLELASLTNGKIIGIDIDQFLLNILMKKVKETNLTNRIKTIKRSLFNMKFADESFDIVWAEGSIFPIGFRGCLTEWRRIIKPHGFLVLHDEIGEVENKLALIASCGYDLISHFLISGDIWWTEYYQPLENRIVELRKKYQANLEVLAILDKEQNGIDEFKQNPKHHGSIFFVMQKTNAQNQ